MASTLIQDTLTMTAPGEIKPHQDIFINDDKITQVGDHGSFPAEADDVIDGTHRLFMPGLIDSHLHTGQQLLRGRVLDTKGIIWKKIMLPFEANTSAETMTLNAQLAALEMITSGTTGFVDAGGYHMAAAGTVYAQSGLRGALAYSTMDDPRLPASINMDAKTAIAHTDALYDQFHGRHHLQVYYSLRALNNCSDELVDLAAQRAADRHTFLEAHMNEYPQEVAGILTRCGERPYVYLAKRGALSDHFLGAHSLFLDDAEKALIEKYHVKLNHSPFSNSGKGVPPTPELLKAGVSIGLGTDGAAHGGLSLWQEMKIFRAIMTLHYGVPQHIANIMPATTIMSLVLDGGAAALNMSGQLGRIAPGYQADIIGLDIDSPHLWPTGNWNNTLLESVNANDVADSMVAGKWLMRKRKVLTLDVERIKAVCARRYPTLWQSSSSQLATS
ncbi:MULTISPECIES: amidohydrolase family protein [Lacticaseibacillus]|uniref:Amidohydrolase n=2 Tax=Lacticaseibacillus TaxID=2759736 RepID=A0AAN1C5P3_LACCA|nr:MULTISPECIES: amidohydrolase family protein [Lacticaseibacillus]ARY90277.1 amidohydrolase [Lacticaseibacillus casei]KAB1969979.1 amidohydrolase family protein [Lacticaseibacillus casei]WLV80892.1 amidohydrolase family protein [Lacticaseibacillus sp. NCIMB 15473]WNX24852.1 amidohydrolase family protein [Lacticaseibacillus casei]WNX27624.1 amidohydrolase family protein [Lacticaseibacillus casei]